MSEVMEKLSTTEVLVTGVTLSDSGKVYGTDIVMVVRLVTSEETSVTEPMETSAEIGQSMSEYEILEDRLTFS